MPSRVIGKRRRTDSYLTQKKGALQANNNEIGNRSEDTLHEKELSTHDNSVLGDDKEACKEAWEIHLQLSKRLEVLRLRLGQFSDVSSHISELNDMAKRIFSLEARVGRLERELSIQYRFITKENLADVTSKYPAYPFVCPVDDCRTAYTRQDRLYKHFYAEPNMGHKLLATLVTSAQCFICLKHLNRQAFWSHLRKEHSLECSSKLELFGDVLASIAQHDDAIGSEPDTPDCRDRVDDRKASVGTTSTVDTNTPFSNNFLDTVLQAHPAAGNRLAAIVSESREKSSDPVHVASQAAHETSSFKPSGVCDSKDTDSHEKGSNSEAPTCQNSTHYPDSALEYPSEQQHHIYDPQWMFNQDFSAAQQQHTYNPIWLPDPNFAEVTEHVYQPRWDLNQDFSPSAEQQMGTDWIATIQSLRRNQKSMHSSSGIPQTQPVPSAGCGASVNLDSAQKLAATKS